MKIHFLGIGVQKAGTTTLHDVLTQHSQIYLPAKKEAHFFDDDERYKKGLPWLFETFFSEYSHEKIVGKFTPEYIYFEEVPKRILATLGVNTKFIVVFRNPAERAASHYNMSYRRGYEKKDFWTAIAEEPERIKLSPWHKSHFSYISRGFYAQQLKRYLALFPIENFLFLTFENDIQLNFPQTIMRILDFLGVERENLNCNIKSNEAYAPKSVRLMQIKEDIRKNKYIRNVFHAFLPSSKIRQAINIKIQAWNRANSPKKKLFQLTSSEKQKLNKQYFEADTLELETLTGLSLKNLWNYE